MHDDHMGLHRLPCLLGNVLQAGKALPEAFVEVAELLRIVERLRETEGILGCVVSPTRGGSTFQFALAEAFCGIRSAS